jgi:hypothetical protein
VSLENAKFGEFEIPLAGSCVTQTKGYTHSLRKGKAVCVAGGNPAVSLQVLCALEIVFEQLVIEGQFSRVNALAYALLYNLVVRSKHFVVEIGGAC